jgi:hypothetical protein
MSSRQTGKNIAGNANNYSQIERAIDEASRNLNVMNPGWKLTVDVSFQLANRFACAWKIATLVISVVLVYLGFLKADECGIMASPSPMPCMGPTRQNA